MSPTGNQPTAQTLGLGLDQALPDEQRVDWNNWTLPPYNRWSFRNVQQVTRTARIPRAETPADIPRNTQDINAWAFRNSAGENERLQELLARTWTDGFLVMHRGAIVSEQYFNGMQANTLHLMMSCSKSFTSSLAGIAVAEGLLDPTRQLTDYVPELAATGMAGATVQNALDMRVGLKFNEDYEDLAGDWRDCEVATGWREPAPDYAGPRDMIGYMRTLTESTGPHGDVFHYQSILSDAVGICLERASGHSFIDWFGERIWQPLGAEQDLVSIVDASGIAVFEGGFNCCLRDFGRFAAMICAGGTASTRATDGQTNVQQLVPASWIEACRFPDADVLDGFARGEYGEVMPRQGYHNNWWIRDPARGVIMALGIHGQTLFIDPAREFVVAKFSSQPAHTNPGFLSDQVLAFEAIAERLTE